VYAVGHPELSDDAILLAAVMACGPLAGLSHDHALDLYGLISPWMEIDRAEINVSVPEECGRGRRPGIRVHRVWLPRTEVGKARGVPVTNVARTIADYGRVGGTRELERAVDQAVSESLVTVEALQKAAAARPSSRGPAALGRLLAAAERFDSVTASMLEEEFVTVVRAGGLPMPALNQRIEGMKVDAVWPPQRVVVELDGYRWHRTRARQENDRAREAKLRRAGWLPIRYSKRQVFEEPLLVVSDLAAVLAGRR
jgi:very-short-patch-repair endonuclease